MAVQEQEVSRSLQATFFLGGVFSWQEWRSKPQNGAISHTIPSLFRVVVLVRPQQIKEDLIKKGEKKYFITIARPSIFDVPHLLKDRI